MTQLESNNNKCYTSTYIYIQICLENKSNSSSSLDSIIKETKLKHNYVFVNKLVNIRLNLTIYDDIILYFFHVYLSNIDLRVNCVNLKIDFI